MVYTFIGSRRNAPVLAKKVGTGSRVPVLVLEYMLVQVPGEMLESKQGLFCRLT